MTPSFKSLRYTTAIAVSLVALSTANQAYATCDAAGSAGNDTITCTSAGGANAAVDLLAGNDMLTNDAGSTIDSGSGSGNIAITKDAAGTFTLNNNGTIQAANAGNSGGSSLEDDDGAVVFIGAGTTSATITNAGTIQNTGSAGSRPSEGILSNSAVTINNSGSITSLVDGITVRGSGDVTINNLTGGLIESFDDDSGGGFIGFISNSIEVDKSGGVVTIDNSGTIRGKTVGMSIESDVSGGITNNAGGLITNTRNLVSGAIDFTSSMSGDILNNGTILGATAGIKFGSAGTFSGTLTNNNLIQGGGQAAILLQNATVAGGGIINNATGIIRRTSGGSGVISVSDGDISSGITNAGLIENTGGGTGIVVWGFSSGPGDISGGINNSGIIRGGIGIQVSDTSSGAAISGGINNSGTIEGTGGTAIEFTDISGASPININGGRIIGDVTDNFGAGTSFSPVTITGSGFDTEGDFTVSSLAVNAGREFRISTGDTFNTRSMSTAGTINFEVDAAGAVGALNVTNGAINLNGGTVGAEVDAAADGVLTDGQEIQIGTGTAALIGTTGAVGQTLTTVTDDSLLWDFAIADGGQADITTGGADNTDLFFKIVQAASAGGSAITNNANSAGTTVNTLLGSTDPQFALVAAKVNAASTSEELEAILQAVLPQVDGASLTAAQNVTGNTIRLVSDRLTTIRGTGGGTSGISSGDLTENLQMWGQVFGQNIEQGLRKGIAGYDADTYGVTVGADTEGLHDEATIGLAFSYANTDVDSDNVTNTQSDINSYNVTLYGDYDLDNDTYVVGDIGYTYGDNETTRFNVGGVAGLNADSDYGSHQFQARAIVGRDYTPSQYEGLRVTPKAQVRYTHYQNEDISETGAGGANLNVESEGLNSLELGVGIDVRKDYVQNNGGILSPEVSVGYRYDVIGDAVQTTSTFDAGGASFKTEGTDPDQDTLNFGVGVGYTTPSSMEFTVSYDYENKDEFDSHSAFIRLAAPF